jgi:histidinol-phosphatase
MSMAGGTYSLRRGAINTAVGCCVVDPDLAFALRLADLADSIALPRFQATDLLVETKPDLTPVTEVDREVERAIRERIAADRPGEVVLGEEFGPDDDAGATGRWIVDPIDGTKNYVRGIPVWATLIALERAGDLALGVVSAPALAARRWWAARGQGAFAGDRRLSVSKVERIEDAQVCYGGMGAWRRAGMLDGLMDLIRRSWRSRGYGDFWMHMLVAEGAADVAAEMEVSIWDMAAVKVIVEEAGGTFTDLTGRSTASGGSGMSSNGLLHVEALAILTSNGGGATEGGRAP